MARIRSIKPAFWASEAIATRLPGPDGRQARLLFIGLWGLAEDLTGVLRGHPSRIRSDLFAYDDDVTPADVERWLGLLEAGRFIVRYERDGSRYVWVRGFVEHQKIDKPSKSTLPEPSDHEKDHWSEPSPSPPRALPEPSVPEVVSRKGGGEDGERELPLAAVASAAPDSEEARGPTTADTDPKPEALQELWNRLAQPKGLPRWSAMGKQRKEAARARLKAEPRLEAWEAFLKAKLAEPFFLGENNRRWKADVDWLLRAERPAQVTDFADSPTLPLAASHAHTPQQEERIHPSTHPDKFITL